MGSGMSEDKKYRKIGLRLKAEGKRLKAMSTYLKHHLTLHLLTFTLNL
jgi:hypothetical protein